MKSNKNFAGKVKRGNPTSSKIRGRDEASYKEVDSCSNGICHDGIFVGLVCSRMKPTYI